MGVAGVGLPDVGAPVLLTHWDANSYPSRVQDVTGERVTIAMPTALLAAEDYRRGEPFELTWTRPSGVHILPVQLVGSRTEQRLRLWELSVSGDGWVEQRRKYVRVPLTAPVSVASGSSALAGELVEISEAAMRCVLSVPYDDPRVAAGQRVDCRLEIRGGPLAAAGVVGSTRPGASPEKSQVIVRLELSDREIATLRTHVSAAAPERHPAGRDR